ncbi:MAG: peptidylprolyl isomerase [Solirubrobacterales bacterium]|nr:peptidylprolyl isomerase [Solirubrobacterales bacterium]
MRARRRRHNLSPRGVVTVSAVILALTACGGGGPARVATRANVASEEPRGPADPSATIARIGPYSLKGAMFNSFVEAALRSESASEPLIPPQFNACVAHLRAEAVTIGEHANGPSQLRSECQTRYQAVLQAALERLISDEWWIVGAREFGVSVSEPGGRRSADVALEARARLASEAIRRAVLGRVAPVTRAQIVSYYEQHRFEYLVAGERDLRIARTLTRAAAATVKADVASGRSFASVVKRLTVQQPVDSSAGLVLELQPHTYGEPNLNEAIFTAAPHVLSGPVDTWFGYFVFEVTKVRSERETPLAEVEASIRQRLQRPRQERALATFDKQWNATWTARTSCSPGDVIPKCRQFRGVPVAPPEDLSTLD